MKQFAVAIFLIYGLRAFAQPTVYTASNLHSHNDYEQALPFWNAYHHGFGSIEADIFLIDGNDELLVAHTNQELTRKKRRLDSLYLIPLVECIRKNKGRPYPGKSKNLQLLIDIKTGAEPTMRKLVATIQRYPELTRTPGLKFVISGNRPAQDSFVTYPSFIEFDGELNKIYSNEAMHKIALLSDNLKWYTLWNGQGDIPANERAKLDAQISRAHRLNKPVRFWNAPDDSNAWHALIDLRVDYINTDKIESLPYFLHQLKK